MRKKRSNGPAVAGITALIALGVWMFGNMGFGTGSADSDGAGKRPDAPQQERVEPSPVAAPTKPPAKTPEPKPAADEAPAAARIAVKGTACEDAGGTATPCDALCATLGKSDPTREVVVDAATGAHGTVETLRKCLKDAGLTKVQVVGGPPPE
jgi:hypothetical protein